jgi:hypothetical protein
MLQKMRKRVIAHHQAAVGQLPEQSPQRENPVLGDPRQNPISFARHKIVSAPAHLQRRRTADGALTTLTMNVLATERQDWPEATAATTRSRRSKE